MLSSVKESVEGNVFLSIFLCFAETVPRRLHVFSISISKTRNLSQHKLPEHSNVLSNTSSSAVLGWRLSHLEVSMFHLFCLFFKRTFGIEQFYAIRWKATAHLRLNLAFLRLLKKFTFRKTQFIYCASREMCESHFLRFHESVSSSLLLCRLTSVPNDVVNTPWRQIVGRSELDLLWQGTWTEGMAISRQSLPRFICHFCKLFSNFLSIASLSLSAFVAKAMNLNFLRLFVRVDWIYISSFKIPKLPSLMNSSTSRLFTLLNKHFASKSPRLVTPPSWE